MTGTRRQRRIALAAALAAPLVLATDPVAGATRPQPAAMSSAPGSTSSVSATRITLFGSKYRGYATRGTANGEREKVLRFTTDQVEIIGLEHRADLGNGADLVLRAQEGKTTVAAHGPIELYATRIRAQVPGDDGPVSIVITPNGVFPPDYDAHFLTLPVITMENATVEGFSLDGGVLSIPGAVIKLR